MKRFLIFTAFVAMLLTVCGCSKEYPVIPVYGKVYVSPSDLIPGQKFKVKIQVKEQGSGFYRGYYTVKISKGGETVIDKTIKVIDPTKGEPVLEDDMFAVTSRGTYSISCTVSLDTSTPLPTGQVAANPPVESNTFVVK